MSHRLYNEKEIAAILRRASVLSPDASDETRVGLTLEELRQIGLESGLDPDAVVAAARELESSPVLAPSGFFGGPLTHTSTVVLDYELAPEQWEDMLVAIRRSFGKPGIVQTRSLVYEWVQSERQGETGHVSATVRNGKTKIQVFWSDPTSAIPFFIPTMVGSIISLPLLFEEMGLGVEGIPIWMAIVATLFLISRMGVSYRGRRGVKRVEALAQELRTLAASSRSASRREVAGRDSIPLPEDDAVHDDQDPVHARTRTR